jgi:hypothetical protein
LHALLRGFGCARECEGRGCARECEGRGGEAQRIISSFCIEAQNKAFTIGQVEQPLQRQSSS